MQHERCRTALAVDLEGDLRILDFEEIVPGAFCEYFVFRLPRNLDESLAALPRHSQDGIRSKLVAPDVSVERCRVERDRKPTPTLEYSY